MTLNIALVGAGGMGMRHATGYIELRKYFDDLRMVAVCDPHIDSAEAVASVIAESTSETPSVFPSLTDAADTVALDAVDIVTSTPAHHVLAIEAMRSGLHVMVEKPMGLTLTACRMMQSVEQETGKVLSISENFRRDPMNRLAKSLIDSGAIGNPYFAVDFSISSAHRGVMHSTVWRAKKDQAGGVVLDAGVHNADLLLYLMGPAVRVYAETDVNDPQRIMRPMSDQAPGLAAMYAHRREPDTNPFSPGEREKKDSLSPPWERARVRGKNRVSTGDIVEQDAVDTAFATIRFSSGAAGQLIITDASHGYSLGDSVVVGSEGTLYRPPSRQGTGPRIVRADGTAIEGDALLDLVPDFEIDDVTSTLWDGERRMSSYEMDFRKIDAKILAIEYMDLAGAVADGRSPEVGSTEGMAALALAYGVMESGEANQAVNIEDVLSGAVSRFQDDIDLAAGIVRVLRRTGFAVFGYREYRLFWIAAAFSNVGMWTLVYGRLWLMRSLTESEILLGSVTAATMAPVMIFSVWGGVVADTVNRLRLLRFTRFLFAIAGLVTAVLIATDTIEAWHLLAISAITGVMLAFDIPTRGAMVASLVPREQLPSAISLYSVVFGGARHIGTIPLPPPSIRRRHGRTLLHRLRLLCTYSTHTTPHGPPTALRRD